MSIVVVVEVMREYVCVVGGELKRVATISIGVAPRPLLKSSPGGC